MIASASHPATGYSDGESPWNAAFALLKDIVVAVLQVADGLWGTRAGFEHLHSQLGDIHLRVAEQAPGRSPVWVPLVSVVPV